VPWGTTPILVAKIVAKTWAIGTIL